MCDLARFNPRAVIKDRSEFFPPVVYVIGRQNGKSTAESVRLPDEDVDPTIITGFGDGTVPEYSASDRLVSRDGDIVRVTTDQSEHLAILNSVEVKVLLEAWLTDIGFSTHARKRT